LAVRPHTSLRPEPDSASIYEFPQVCGLPALAVALVNTGAEEGPPKTVASRSPAQTSQSMRTRA